MAKLSKRVRFASSCLVACAGLVCWLHAGAARADDAPGLRRFALTVAANDGGAARERLHYAVHDARAVATREGASTRVLYWPGFAFGVRL